jgi:hypothetical protein
MKYPLFKKTTVSALCLAAVGFSGISWGHPISGVLNRTPASAANVDVFHVVCSTLPGGLAPNRFVGQVTRGPLAGTVRLSIARSYNPATGAAEVSTASVVESSGVASAWTQQPSSNGSEHVAVFSHTTTAANTYTGKLHCENSTGGAIDSAGAEVGTKILGLSLDGLTGTATPMINQ